MLSATLTIGIVVSVIATELVGLSPGGIIVPGYVALMLDRPQALVGMLVIAAVTHLVVRLAANTLFLYGTRRFSFTVLVGVTLSFAARSLFGPLPAAMSGLLEWPGLGYIVPALLAHQWERQGVLPTLLLLAVTAPLVRLLAVFLT